MLKTQTFETGTYDIALSESQMLYGTAGRLTSQRKLSAPGSATSSADTLVEILYDSRNLQTQRTTHLNATQTAVATFIYDNAGRRITRTQSDGPTVASLYTASGDLTKQITNPAGLAIATSYAYDEMGRTTRITNPDSTYAVSIYDSLGRLTKTQAYDSANTALAKMQQLYDDNLNTVTKTYQYAAPVSQSSFNASTDPSATLLYTATGRLTATVDANANTTRYDYDAQGRRITTTDPASNKTAIIYDNANRVLTRISMDFDGTNHVTFKTAYEYSLRNNVTKTIDQGPDGDIAVTADNLTTITWYDALGQVTQTQNTAGRQTTYTYDALGRTTRQIEDSALGGIGRTTDSVYDRSGRLIPLTGYTSGTTGSRNWRITEIAT